MSGLKSGERVDDAVQSAQFDDDPAHFHPDFLLLIGPA
jgi:hypothetical protein